jgi:hypothetical protein
MRADEIAGDRFRAGDEDPPYFKGAPRVAEQVV